MTLPAHTVGIDLHPEEEAKLHAEKKPAYQVCVECNFGAIKLRISGSVIGRITFPKPNEFSKQTKLSFKRGGRHPGDTAFRRRPERHPRC